MAEQGVTISHGISCPIRNHLKLKGRDVEKWRELHHLFALPGPASQKLTVDDVTEEGNLGSDDEDVGEPLFRILLDVTQFKPEDILIQVFEGCLIVRGQHAVQMDEHGFVSRSFTRLYQLPDKQLQTADLTAMMCHDGILVVETKERWWTAAD